MSVYAEHIRMLQDKYQLPPGLLGAVMRAESGGNPSARSPVGAIGLMQLMPGTARGLGVDPFDPLQNLEGGAKYLSQQLKRFHSVPLALAAYNAGPGAVAKYNGVPPYRETQEYVKRIRGYMGERPFSGLKQAPQRGFQGMPAQSGATLPAEGLKQLNTIQKRLRTIDQMGGLTAPGAASMLSRDVARAENAIYRTAIPTPTTITSQAKPPIQQGNNPFKWWEKRFGLQRSSSDNDAPGVHTEGSYHYRPAKWGGVQGYDYGDARNDPKKLLQLGYFIKKNPEIARNISEAYYDPWGFRVENGQIINSPLGGHQDHLHLAFGG